MQRRHRRAHARIWLILAVLLPAGFLAGLVLRQERPVESTTFVRGAPPEAGGRAP